jgi:hypothetical protein
MWAFWLVEQVINENTNTLNGDVFHYYVDNDNQCKIDDVEMDDDRVWLNGVLNQLIDIGFRNAKRLDFVRRGAKQWRITC